METIKLKNHTFKVEIEHDIYQCAPWEENDGHGVVSDWTTRDKRPGERILCSDRSSKRYYDVQASIAIAKRDCWGGAGKTKAERATNAVAQDFEYLRAWCNNEWHYVGVIVTLLGDDGEETEFSESLWGVESLDNYPDTVALELAENVLREAERAETIAKIQHVRQQYAGLSVGIPD